MKKFLIIFCVTSFLEGCSTVQLSATGGKVEVVIQFDRKDCKNLGPVYSKNAGSGWIAEEKLMEYATNGLRNKAAEKGATHLVIHPHQMTHTDYNIIVSV